MAGTACSFPVLELARDFLFNASDLNVSFRVVILLFDYYCSASIIELSEDAGLGCCQLYSFCCFSEILLRFGVFLPTALCLVVAAVIALSNIFDQHSHRLMRCICRFFASRDINFLECSSTF